MKKAIIIFAVSLTIGVILSSCKGSEHCPAYGQADTDKVEQNS